MSKLATYLFYITQAEDKIRQESIKTPNKVNSIYRKVYLKVKKFVDYIEETKNYPTKMNILIYE